MQDNYRETQSDLKKMQKYLHRYPKELQIQKKHKTNTDMQNVCRKDAKQQQRDTKMTTNLYK